MSLNDIKIGVIGGSGFYDLLKKSREVEVKTPFGQPSDKITIGEYTGKKIAFLARHGKKHQYPPHKINYRANLWAFKKLGVKKIIAVSASGSLNPKIKLGDFVISDQLIDWTKSRESTFYNGPKTIHISTAEPYCPSLRKLTGKSCGKLKIKHHQKGTVVVIEGPRFSTKAESAFFQKQGFDVINMTQYPEAVLARELEMCYVNISLITDYDAGLVGKGGVRPVDLKEVIRVFNQNNQKAKELIFEMLKNINPDSACSCRSALKNAAI